MISTWVSLVLQLHGAGAVRHKELVHSHEHSARGIDAREGLENPDESISNHLF